MLKFFLGISLTFNILFLILLFFIYRYSYKGLKNKVDSFLLNDFMSMSDEMEVFLHGNNNK